MYQVNVCDDNWALRPRASSASWYVWALCIMVPGVAEPGLHFADTRQDFGARDRGGPHIGLYQCVKSVAAVKGTPRALDQSDANVRAVVELAQSATNPFNVGIAADD